MTEWSYGVNSCRSAMMSSTQHFVKTEFKVLFFPLWIHVKHSIYSLDLQRCYKPVAHFSKWWNLVKLQPNAKCSVSLWTSGGSPVLHHLPSCLQLAVWCCVCSVSNLGEGEVGTTICLCNAALTDSSWLCQMMEVVITLWSSFSLSLSIPCTRAY